MENLEQLKVKAYEFIRQLSNLQAQATQIQGELNKVQAEIEKLERDDKK